MPELQLQVSARLWKDLMSAAERTSRKPQAMAKKALRDYLQRLEDDELFERSCEAARRSGFDFRNTESVIKALRKERRTREAR